MTASPLQNLYFVTSSLRGVGLRDGKSQMVDNREDQYYFKHYDAVNPDGIQPAYAGELYELKSHPGFGLRLDHGYGTYEYHFTKVPLAQAMKF